MRLSVLNGARWDTQHCLPGQELNWSYLSDIIQDAWGQRKLKVTNAYCPEPRLNCRSTCRVGLHTYCFFFFFFLPWLTLKCVFISKSVDGIRLALDGWNREVAEWDSLMCKRPWTLLEVREKRRRVMRNKQLFPFWLVISKPSKNKCGWWALQPDWKSGRSEGETG